MLPQYMALSVSFVSFVSVSKKICVSVRWVTLWVRPPPHLWIYVCPFVGLHCGCVPPLCVPAHCGCVPPSCVSFHWKIIYIGSLHAAYSALRHFLLWFWNFSDGPKWGFPQNRGAATGWFLMACAHEFLFCGYAVKWYVPSLLLLPRKLEC